MPHAALAGWNVDRLAEVLLGEQLGTPSSPHASTDPMDAFVLMAFETVTPANLDTVPVEKIIEVRQKYGKELDQFRKYVADQAQTLAGFRDVRDLSVFEDYLRDEVQQKITAQLGDLREALRSAGLEPVRALANVKTVALPPAAAVVADAIGISPVATGSAALAAAIMTTPARWRTRRKETIRESPVGYLFRIGQELNPRTLLEWLRGSWPRR